MIDARRVDIVSFFSEVFYQIVWRELKGLEVVCRTIFPL